MAELSFVLAHVSEHRFSFNLGEKYFLLLSTERSNSFSYE